MLWHQSFEKMTDLRGPNLFLAFFKSLGEFCNSLSENGARAEKNPLQNFNELQDDLYIEFLRRHLEVGGLIFFGSHTSMKFLKILE